MTPSQMKSFLCQKLQAIHPIGKAACDALEECMQVKSNTAGDSLIKHGERCRSIYFVVKGIIRANYVGTDGADITWSFFQEGEIAVNYPAYLNGVESQFNYEAIEDSCCISFHKASIDSLYGVYPELNFIGRVLTEQGFLKHHNRSQSFLLESPEERYLKLLEVNPTLFQRVPQRHVATFLGIKPESLSRLKKRMYLRAS